MKKRRGAGNRGGRGNAGSGKKGDGKKPSYWKNYKGGKDPSKRGFNSLNKDVKTINIGHLSSIAETLVREGKALEKSGSIVINLNELGYGKLLGAGSATKKLKIGVREATDRAVAKIEEAGGTVDVQGGDAASEEATPAAEASE